MKDSGEQDDLWQLLGKAKTPTVSPYFARNVLREIRSTKPEKTGALGWFSGHWRLASLGSVAAVLLALNSVQLFVPQKVVMAPAQPAQQNAGTPTKTDYEVIKNLDELVAYRRSLHMVGRFHTVGFFATLVLLGLMNVLCHAQDASPQPSPASSSSPPPRPNFFQGNNQKRPPEDRPFFKKGNGDFAQARKILQDLSPEQREKFLDNFQRWQNMTPEEKNALRDREAFRRQRILQEIDKSITESGLQLDKDAREMYVLRYSQERRKIEEKLQKDLEEKRRPLLEDMNNRLKEEFKAIHANPSPSPASSESSSTPAPEASASPAK